MKPVSVNSRYFILSALFITAAAAAVFTERYWLACIPFGLLFFYSGWLHKEFFFFLLIASLPFSIEFQLTPALGTDLPDEWLMLAVSLTFFCAWLYKPALIKREILLHPLVLLLALCFFWSIVSTFFSTDKLLSFKYLLAKTWYFGAFVLSPLILFRKKRNVLITAIVFSVSLMLVTVIILVRHSTGLFSFTTINEAAGPFFRNHVNYSSMLVCLFPLLIVFYFTSSSKKRRKLLTAGIIIALAALFFTYARGAWVALLAGLSAWGFMRAGKLFNVFLAGLMIVVFSFYWLSREDRYLQFTHDYKTTIFHQNFGEHLLATYRLKDVSTAERFYRWIAGIRMTRDMGLTGSGPNTFYQNYKSSAIPVFKTWVSNNNDHSTIHNYFLLVLAEQGYPGLIFFLLLVSALIYYAQRTWIKAADPFYKYTALAAGMMLLMICTVNFLSDLIETDKVGSMFYLCLSVLIIADLQGRGGRSLPQG